MRSHISAHMLLGSIFRPQTQPEARSTLWFCGHFRKLYLRVCEMRKFVRKLSLAEIALQRAARGFGSSASFSQMLQVGARDPLSLVRYSASRIAIAASTLATGLSTNTGCEPPHCAPRDKPRPGPTVRLRDGNNLVVDHQQPEPIWSWGHRRIKAVACPI